MSVDARFARCFFGICSILFLLASLCGCKHNTDSDAPSESASDALMQQPLPYAEQTKEQLYLPDTNPLSEQKVIASWIPYFQYADLFAETDEAEARNRIRSLLSGAKAMGINTIFAHVCAFGEAYYHSEHYALADLASDFDCLQILAEECDALSLSLHAWLNPLRLQAEPILAKQSQETQIAAWYQNPQTNGRYVVKVDSRWYLNPAYPAVQEFLAKVITELLLHYDIDGIHIDDYFYPTTAPEFDAEAFADSGEKDLTAWRTSNINTLVSSLYRTTHSLKPHAVFSISPQGNMHQNQTKLYADSTLWCSQTGYCDWIIPQLYYGYENQTMPFEQTFSDWCALKRADGVSLMIGLAAYKVGVIDAFAGSGQSEWQEHSGILAEQTADVLENSTLQGVAFYHLDATLALSQREETALSQVILQNRSETIQTSSGS